MENIEKIGLDQFDGVNLGDQSKSYLKEIAKWSLFFGILGFIGCGLILCFSLFFLIMDPFSNLATKNAFGPMGFMSSSIIVLLYLILGLIYFMPSLYIYKSAIDLKKGLNNNDEKLIESGFSNLKSCFKFWGILTIVIISFYLLIFGAGMIGSIL